MTNTEVETIVNPTFHLKVKKKDDESDLYKEYRSRWENYPKLHKLGKFPIHVDLESTARCNLECVMCFQSDHTPETGWRNKFGYIYDRKPQEEREGKATHYGDMPMSLFKKIIDEGRSDSLIYQVNGTTVDDRLRSIKLQYRGEPLMHKELEDMVAYAKQKGVIETMFNTNGNLLDEKRALRFIEAGLDKIIFSMDGSTPDVYEEVRKGHKGRIKGLFDVVVRNIATLKYLRDKQGRDKPYIRVQAVYQDLNKEQIDSDDYIKFWSQYADHVAVEDCNDYHENGRPAVVAPKFACDQLWQRLFVNFDGRITLCCGDVYSKQVVGNAYKDSLQDIWQSQKLNYFRQLHLKGESHNMGPCNSCGYRDTIIKNHHPDDWTKYTNSPEYTNWLETKKKEGVVISPLNV